MTSEPTGADREPPPPNAPASLAFVLGLLSFVGGLTALPGLLAGVIGLRRSRRLGGAGKWLAISGMILSCVGFVVLALVVQNVLRLREAAERMVAVCHLKCLGLAIHSHYDACERLPSPFIRDPKAPFVPVPESELASKLSWRVSILPFIEQHRIHEQMALDQPWDSPTNRPFAAHVVRTFTDPDTRDDPDTRYRIFCGPGTAFPLDRPGSLAAIADGASTTLFAVESGEKVTWTRFNEIRFDPANPPDPATMGRPNTSTFYVLTADGAVVPVRKTMNPQVFKALITAHAGDRADFDDH